MKKLKRHKGIMSIPEAIIVTAVLAITVVAFLSPNIPLNNRGKAEEISRKYLIKTQQQGYLSSAQKNDLTNKLKSFGCKNISIQAVDNKVKFSDDVGLVVGYDVEVKELKINQNAFPTFETNTKRVIIDKGTVSSTT